MDIDERRKVVSRYLRRCVTYSDASIARKLKREEDPNEIARWQAFREFTAYSASEMESGALDTWLTDEEGDPPPPPKIGDGSYKIAIDALVKEKTADLADRFNEQSKMIEELREELLS